MTRENIEIIYEQKYTDSCGQIYNYTCQPNTWTMNKYLLKDMNKKIEKIIYRENRENNK